MRKVALLISVVVLFGGCCAKVGGCYDCYDCGCCCSVDKKIERKKV